MSSWTFETYDDGKNYAEYRWDKCNHFEVIAGRHHNGVVITEFHNTYANVEGAKRAFKRQVRRIYETK